MFDKNKNQEGGEMVEERIKKIQKQEQFQNHPIKLELVN